MTFTHYGHTLTNKNHDLKNKNHSRNILNLNYLGLNEHKCAEPPFLLPMFPVNHAGSPHVKNPPRVVLSAEARVDHQGFHWGFAQRSTKPFFLGEYGADAWPTGRERGQIFAVRVDIGPEVKDVAMDQISNSNTLEI